MINNQFADCYEPTDGQTNIATYRASFVAKNQDTVV